MGGGFENTLLSGGVEEKPASGRPLKKSQVRERTVAIGQTTATRLVAEDLKGHGESRKTEEGPGNQIAGTLRAATL